MGLLSSDYYDNILKTPITAPPPTKDDVAAEQEPVQPAPVKPISDRPLVDLVDRTKPLTVPGTTPLQSTITPLRTEESQIRKFGGVVGSAEYYRYKADHPYRSYLPQQLGSSFGLRFPDQETWDRMNFAQRATHTATEIPKAGLRLLRDLPKEIIKAPIRTAATIISPWERLAQGKPGSLRDLATQPVIELPLLGQIPTYFQTYDQARQAGLSKGTALLQSGSFALGDIAMTGALGEAMVAGFRPRAKLAAGETIANTKPIKNAFIEERGVTKVPSTSDYFSLPKLTAKNFDGKSSNTFLKVTPAGSDAVEVAVVRSRAGAVPAAVDYVKNKLGVPTKTYNGSFGKEIKLEAQIVKADRNIIEATPKPNPKKTLAQIPSKPLKGFESKFITEGQMTHLYDIAKINGVESGIRDAVIRTVTGKNVIGDLSQAEYVSTAQTLAKFNNMSKYAPNAPGMNAFSRYASPQRHWMRSYQEKGGFPLYSEVYVPMEEGIRLRNVFRTSYRNEARDIFGKYSKPGFGDERILINSYMKGDKAAITKNPALSSATKTELIKIAEDMRVLYDKVGPELGVPTDVFLKDYQPHVQDIGGVHQLYKSDVTKIPESINFFAKFKRRGGLGIAVDDSLALWDIYINAGSNSTFMSPVVKRTSEFSKLLPETIQGSVKSYALERMGYAGNLEKLLNKYMVGVNKKLGTNFPEDAARKLTQVVMDTTYSGALGANPGKALRNSFQTEFMTYPRLGPRFYAEAAKKALDPKAHTEVRGRGFLVELGVPFGRELSEGLSPVGAVGSRYRKITQGTLGPYSLADQVNRVRTYHQLKFQFDDAIARYNKGKITWPQLENQLDFRAYGPANRQIIRERLIRGDMQGAFENMVREVLDETHFPYRRGSSSRITFGLGGKIGTQFLQWPIEFVHTHARWLRTGQFDKIIRFWASSSAVTRSLKESVGVDPSNFAFYNPINNPSFSPFVRSAIDTMEMINGLTQKNAQQLETNKDELVRAAQTLLIPGGAQVKNVKDFLKSYNKGPVGPNGEYGVYDSRNRLKYYATFAELWMDLWGIPSNKQESERRTSKEIRNERFDFTQAKRDVLMLYQQEKYDEANEIIEKYGINVGPRDFDQYFIPLNQRSYQALPASLKAKFAPKIFNQQ